MKMDSAECTYNALQEIQELQEKVTAMRSEPSPLEAARAELAACEGDRQKFMRLLEQLQVHVLPCARLMGLMIWPLYDIHVFPSVCCMHLQASRI